MAALPEADVLARCEKVFALLVMRSRLVLVLLSGLAVGGAVTPLPASAATTVSPPERPLLAYLVDADRDGRYGVAVRSLDTGTDRVVVPEPAAAGGLLSDPRLSPDGRTVAYVSSIPGSRRLLLVPSDGSARPTEIKGLDRPRDQEWSPDGGSLVVTVGSADAPHPAVVATSGGPATEVPGAVGTQPAFSRDGTRLVYVTLDGLLEVVGVHGGGAVGLGVPGTDPVWSPTQGLIAYSAGNHLETTAPVAGSDTPVVTATQPGMSAAIGPFDRVVRPAWSDDGTNLYFEVDHVTSSGTPTTREIDAVLLADLHGDSLRRVLSSSVVSHANPSFRGPVPSVVVSGVKSVFVPVSPVRVLSTLAGVGAARAKVPAGGVLDVRVTGPFPPVGVPVFTVPADATAVVLNVTSVFSLSDTDVRVYPTPAAGVTAYPPVSNVNVPRGQSTPNLVTVKVGVGGLVRLRNQAGSTDLLADFEGYFTPLANRATEAGREALTDRDRGREALRDTLDTDERDHVSASVANG